MPFRLAPRSDCSPCRSCWRFHSSPPLGGPQTLRPTPHAPRAEVPHNARQGALRSPGPAAPPLANRRLGRRVTSRRFSQTNRIRGERWASPRRAGRSVRLSGGERARPPAAAASGCAAPGQARAGAGAQVGRGRVAWRWGSAVGVQRRPPWPFPAPSRRSPALPGRGAGGGGGAARGSGARGAAGASGAGVGGPHLIPGRPPPARGPGAERPRGTRRSGGPAGGGGSGVPVRAEAWSLRMGREEAAGPAAGEEVGPWAGVAARGRARLGSAPRPSWSRQVSWRPAFTFRAAFASGPAPVGVRSEGCGSACL